MTLIRNHVAEIVAHDRATLSSVTFRFSQIPVSVDDVWVPGRILELPIYESSLDVGGISAGGVVQQSGSPRLTLTNLDHSLDSVLDTDRYRFDGGALTIFRIERNQDGSYEQPWSARRLAARYTISGEPNLSSVVEFSCTGFSLPSSRPVHAESRFRLSGFRDAVWLSYNDSNDTSAITFSSSLDCKAAGFSFRLNSRSQTTDATGGDLVTMQAQSAGTRADISVIYKHSDSALQITEVEQPSGTETVLGSIDLMPDDLEREHHMVITHASPNGKLGLVLDGELHEFEVNLSAATWAAESYDLVLGYFGDVASAAARCCVYNISAWSRDLTTEEMLEYAGKRLSSEDGLSDYFDTVGISSGVTTVSSLLSGRVANLTGGALFGSSCGGTDDLSDTPLPLALGCVKHATPVRLDNIREIYSICSHRVHSVVAFDGGDEFTAASDAADLEEIANAKPSSGEYQVYPPLGIVRLGSAATNTLTASFCAPGLRGYSFEGGGASTLWAARIGAADLFPSGGLSEFDLYCEVAPSSIPDASTVVFRSGSNSDADPLIRVLPLGSGWEVRIRAPSINGGVSLTMTGPSMTLGEPMEVWIKVRGSSFQVYYNGELYNDVDLGSSFTFFGVDDTRVGGESSLANSNIEGDVSRFRLLSPDGTIHLWLDYWAQDGEEWRERSSSRLGDDWYIGNVPAGATQASFTDRNAFSTSAPDALQTVVQRYSTETPIDEHSFDTSHMARPETVSYYSADDISLLDLVQVLSENHGFFCGPDSRGIVYCSLAYLTGQTSANCYMLNPSSERLAISDRDLVTFSSDRERYGESVGEVRVGYCPVWTTDAELSALADDDQKDLLQASDGRFYAPVAPSPGAATAAGLEPQTIDTLFDRRSYAVEHGRRMVSFLGPTRHQVAAQGSGRTLRIGDEVAVFGDFYGLPDPRTNSSSAIVAMVVSVIDDPENPKTDYVVVF